MLHIRYVECVEQFFFLSFLFIYHNPCMTPPAMDHHGPSITHSDECLFLSLCVVSSIVCDSNAWFSMLLQSTAQYLAGRRNKPEINIWRNIMQYSINLIWLRMRKWSKFHVSITKYLLCNNWNINELSVFFLSLLLALVRLPLGDSDGKHWHVFGTNRTRKKGREREKEKGRCV